MVVGIIIGSMMNLFLGFLLISLSVPLLKGNTPRNATFGFRFKSAFQSDEVWKKTNQYGAKWLIRWSALLMILSIASLSVLVLPIAIPVADIGLIFLPIVCVCAPMLQTYQFSKRIATQSSA